MPRLDCSFQVRCVHEGTDFTAQARDVSSTGAALETDRNLELGEIVDLTFDLVGGPSIECVGLVRRRVENCVGVEFHKLAPIARRTLASWLRERLETETSDARRRWADRSDVGEALFDEDAGRLRWHIPFVSLWHRVAPSLSVDGTMFVPTREAAAREGDRVVVELVPPDSHMVLQLLAEVTWVGADGLGLRHSGLTAVDRVVLAAISEHFEREAARYV